MNALQQTAETERQRDYCKKLCKMLTRYAIADELPALVKTLEDFKSTMLQKRYAPGLNDATYDLYANFHLRRVGVTQTSKEVQ
jgi:hypothetical protein